MSMKKEFDIIEGAQLVVVGYIGLKGTKLLSEKRGDQLRQRYNADFVEAAASLYDDAPNTEQLRSFVQDLPFIEVEKGGIFRALWDISVQYRIGFDVDIFDIPVSQKTIELCNFYNVNPYGLLSEKCVLVITTASRTLIKRLEEENIRAAIIGEVTKNNDKMIAHQDGSLHLCPDKKDSIERVLRKDELS